MHRKTLAMAGLFLLFFVFIFFNGGGGKNPLDLEWGQRPRPPFSQNPRIPGCPDYKVYAKFPHPPFSPGDHAFPFQRPSENCRLFKSPAVESLIARMKSKMKDKDLARLFENTFPNTLDTTVGWHRNSGRVADKQSFIVTGDINAQWLRDSTNQLAQYQLLVKDDEALRDLVLGAINTQVSYTLERWTSRGFLGKRLSPAPCRNYTRPTLLSNRRIATLSSLRRPVAFGRKSPTAPDVTEYVLTLAL